MIGIDTNVLVHAHRNDSPWHERAHRCVASLAAGHFPWAIPWPCVHEFLGVVTNGRIYRLPTAPGRALEQMDDWLSSPTVVLIAESGDHWPNLRRLIEDAGVTGPRVHDARIAAICATHGITELWSADRDFGRFPDLKVRNPLVGDPA